VSLRASCFLLFFNLGGLGNKPPQKKNSLVDRPLLTCFFASSSFASFFFSLSPSPFLFVKVPTYYCVLDTDTESATASELHVHAI